MSRSLTVPAALVGAGVAIVTASAYWQRRDPDPRAEQRPQIPASIQEEHAELHGGLEAAASAPGEIGVAARALAAVLGPHFAREEEVALPPLGLLEPLARGEFAPWMSGVLPMTDALAAELPEMLGEHEAISAAAARLEQVAREQGDAEVERLARALQHHARTEEEVLYPAAILVGDLVRLRAR